MSAPASATSPGDRASVTGAGAATPASTPIDGPRADAEPAFRLDAAWVLNPKVAVRPEPFGALLYHFGTRKLSFLKNRTVVGIVQSLHDYPDADTALTAAGIDRASRPLYVQALGALAESGMIIPRQETPS
ncbi:mycofactocin biosynthesis chaperone MftB [Gordonia crocea]|uniref:Putative mycofactocin system protein MftB n=1 Tax=Gordonia crocea TaxID=589162 RepID=A0A7I9V1Q8_9ACTN|nr:mycofactocin biosynthesis chaperone MftB [Gordonia crocea]GED99378.1 putative mycofactocin system protein MftB [Gordonia crocea]